MVKKE